MDNEPKRTVPLNQPLTRYRNPSNRAKSNSAFNTAVQLILPNGQIIPILPDIPFILGRGSTTPNGEQKIDLDSLPGAAEGISRNHALLKLTEGVLYVQDYNSTNGTFVDKTELYPMRSYAVENGSLLMLGKVKIKVKING